MDEQPNETWVNVATFTVFILALIGLIAIIRWMSV